MPSKPGSDVKIKPSRREKEAAPIMIQDTCTELEVGFLGELFIELLFMAPPLKQHANHYADNERSPGETRLRALGLSLTIPRTRALFQPTLTSIFNSRQALGLFDFRPILIGT